MIDKDLIFHHLDQVKDLSFFEQLMRGIENDPIDIELDERPNYRIEQNQIGSFFYDYYHRCSYVKSLLKIDVHDEIIRMIDFINGHSDSVNIYHYSLAPQKMNDDFQFENFSIIQLKEEEYLKLINIYQPIGGLIKIENFPDGYRSLLIDKVIAKRKTSNVSRHLWFDRLDEIYTYHTIIRFLLNFYTGNIQSLIHQVSFDNFPNASMSGNSKFKTENSSLDSYSRERMYRIIKFLKNKLTYRLILRSEISSRKEFERIIFLRSILDPILNINAPVINDSMAVGQSKTNAQAKYILKTLKDNNTRFKNNITEEELTKFLKIRNAIIHPNPADDIEKLHIIYDRIEDLRKTVYDFVFITIEISLSNNLADFELNTEM